MPTLIEPVILYTSNDGCPYTRTDLSGTFLQTGKSSSAWKYTDDRTDRVSDPNWKIKLVKGLNCTNPYRKMRTTVVPLRATLSGSGIVSLVPRHVSRSSGQFSLLPSLAQLGILSMTDSAIQDLALKRLKSKLASQTNNFQALVPLAELREFRGLIRSSAELTTKLVKTLLDIRTSKGRSALNYASKAWLNFSFGVSPMISDTKDLAESIATYMARQDLSLRVVGSASRNWKSSAKGSTVSAFGSDFHWSATVDHKIEYKYIAGISIPLKSANNYGVASHFGLEFGDLVPAFWELVPYSWVIDYFTTTGDFLQDTFTSSVSNTKYCVENRRYTASVQVNGGPRSWPLHSVGGSVRPGSVELFDFERKSLSNLPARSLRFKTVDEVGANAVNRLLNLSSLLVKGKL